MEKRKSYDLSKGEKFNLSKFESLKIARIEMGWKVNQTPGGPIFDLDVSAFMIGNDFKIVDDSCFVFYKSKYYEIAPDGKKRPYSLDRSLYGAVDNKGDKNEENTSGEATEDMLFYLSKTNNDVQQIIIVVTICKYPNDAKRDPRTLSLNFGMVQNCFIRILNEETGVEIMHFNLAQTFGNEDAVEFGRLYRIGADWEFEALGRGSIGSLPALVDQYT